MYRSYGVMLAARDEKHSSVVSAKRPFKLFARLFGR